MKRILKPRVVSSDCANRSVELDARPRSAFEKRRRIELNILGSVWTADVMSSYSGVTLHVYLSCACSFEGCS